MVCNRIPMAIKKKQTRIWALFFISPLPFFSYFAIWKWSSKMVWFGSCLIVWMLLTASQVCNQPLSFESSTFLPSKVGCCSVWTVSWSHYIHWPFNCGYLSRLKYCKSFERRRRPRGSEKETDKSIEAEDLYIQNHSTRGAWGGGLGCCQHS